ncbi:hypothetical protein [Tenacibaculum finnmarkense]|uniref:Uncharacterized protein n=1 Tax=Tenacibaculum finnmarkense genomovar ulcerans TaxID=2781388 RepID=A0A2I2MBG5_9FLAO|nr:hypothetical protein [Tenacibaculum finnmarkense]SOS48866.1 hypothetical protein TNO021_360002 [Tenacibaculum dicentrarchi]MBE7689022.1 hypothetical protein [Tenacibaculum finnmarkense genomovar ulcerans]MBE7698674.1 hypothetical protein [Tenacibaculum finnmarkense genomovar ulcerans]MCD8401300.1 hypothetical protein [Tenacibaculum finnmarkense genomovar ulcerans]MCD8411092.1 hypothetical protein [Tenacibaculum finnmarkense genomovar ulcerans]
MFNSEFLVRIIIDVVLIGFVSVGFGSWLNYKYGKKLKELEPQTAEQILRKENYLNSKRDVFFEVIELINRRFASSEWNGPQVPNNRTIENTRPTEVEINSCYSKLNLYVDDKLILEKYPYLFSGDSNPVEIGDFMSLLRTDLGYGKSMIDSENYPYIFSND